MSELVTLSVLVFYAIKAMQKINISSISTNLSPKQVYRIGKAM